MRFLDKAPPFVPLLTDDESLELRDFENPLRLRVKSRREGAVQERKLAVNRALRGSLTLTFLDVGGKLTVPTREAFMPEYLCAFLAASSVSKTSGSLESMSFFLASVLRSNIRQATHRFGCAYEMTVGNVDPPTWNTCEPVESTRLDSVSDGPDRD